VDESIQVETLKFEQDSAVQVNTLPPMTMLTSRDAYLFELETAIQECTTNLDSLEDVLRSPTPQGGSRGQSSSLQMVRIY
jgi:nesprin-1